MRLTITYIFLLFGFMLKGQAKDNFDDGDLTTNLIWSGEVASFKVDDDKKLRLNAADAGMAFIYTKLNYPDSFDLHIDAKLEFSPSVTNQSKIYFLLDDTDLSKSKSYYIQIGENGSNDALRVYKQDGATSTLLASGLDGKMAGDPSQAKILLKYRNGGNFELLIDYTLDGVTDDQVSWADGSYKPKSNLYFGIQCTFTATRKDKFVYDNFEIKESQVDKIGPEILNLNPIDANTLLITFNEALDKINAEIKNNYSIDGIGTPISATLIQPTTVELKFQNNFTANTTYTLIANNITDTAGNKSGSQSTSFSLNVEYVLGDLVISELLFDPYVNQVDFVELYNTTARSINLKNLAIKNFSNGQTQVINTDINIGPRSYLALTSNVESVKATYLPPDSSQIAFQALPAFNNDIGNVSILNKDGLLLDSFTYRDDLHLLIDDPKNIEGVSLEKVKLLPFDNSIGNWASCIKPYRYATPGYANSSSYDDKNPDLLKVSIIDSKNIILEFNDVVLREDVVVKQNYNLQPAIEVSTAQYHNGKVNEVKLTFEKDLLPTEAYVLTVENLRDKHGNKMNKKSIPLIFGETPKVGDLVISEILFNPYTGGYDFVELSNTTEKNIEVGTLSIKNENNGQVKKIPSHVMPPKSYLALTFNVESQRFTYMTPDTARYLQMSLPSFNVGDGNVSVLDQNSEYLDSFYYSETMHHELINATDVKGISLEKINLKAFENKNAWHSAAKAVKYATPGYANSNSYIDQNIVESSFIIKEKLFTPNQDGNKDYLIIQYKLPAAEYLATLDVYSLEGYKVKNLSNADLLGTEGIITWDGTNDDGNLERTGIYIIKGKFYNTDGAVINVKKECVLAGVK